MTTGKSDAPLGRGAIAALACACGVAVSTIYFPQALTPLVGREFGVGADVAARIVIASQAGYAAGLYFLTPLGDRLPPRKLICALMAATALALLAAAQAPTLGWLIAFTAFAGFATVVPQIILPMAAGLVDKGRSGAVTGSILSGLLAGILLSRTFGGFVGEHFGWRAPYLVAAIAVLIIGIVLWRIIPDVSPDSKQSYSGLLHTTVRLFASEPELRRSCFYQALMFGAFTASWTTLPLVLGEPMYGFGGQAVGLIALVGAASVFATPFAGRLVDRRGSDVVNWLGLLLGIISAGVLALGSYGGVVGLIGLTLGMLLLDVAVQGGQVANQARIFALRPEARSRLNTAYMTCAFLGGSIGSALGTAVFLAWHWPGLCILIAVAASVALTRHYLHHQRPGERAKSIGS